MNEYFSEFYYNDENIFTDPNRLWQKIKEDMKYRTIKYKKRDFLQWVYNQEQYQLNKVNNKPNNFHTIVGRPGCFQIDITFYDQYSRLNAGYSCILTIIEITSRKAWAYSMKSKKADEVLQNFKLFHNVVKKINLIEVDGGNEFLNTKFKAYCKDNEIDIKVYTNDKHSMGLIERFNRTIRNAINNIAPNYELWYIRIPTILNVYNNTKHTTTKYTPNEVYNDELLSQKVRQVQFLKGLNASKKLSTFNIGDKVRYYIDRNFFGKGNGKYSKSIHTIEKIEHNSIYISNKDDPFRFYELLKVTESIPPPKPIDTESKEQEDKLNLITRRLNKAQLRDQDVSMKEHRENVLQQLNTMNEPRPKRERKLTEKAKELLEAKENKNKLIVTF
jgi:hypothetical protein